MKLCVVIFEPELTLVEESQSAHHRAVEYQRASVGDVSNHKLIGLLNVKSAPIQQCIS